MAHCSIEEVKGSMPFFSNSFFYLGQEPLPNPEPRLQRITGAYEPFFDKNIDPLDIHGYEAFFDSTSRSSSSDMYMMYILTSRVIIELIMNAMLTTSL